MLPRRLTAILVAAALTGCTPGSAAVSPAPQSVIDGGSTATIGAATLQPASTAADASGAAASLASPVTPPPGVPPTPPATAEEAAPPTASGAGTRGSQQSATVYPPAAWAAGELAVRGFVRNPKQRLVVIDPGHGGPEVGAASGKLAEKNVNLAIALKLQGLLDGAGYQTLLTRTADTRVYAMPEADAANSYNPVRADLQARVDLANAARADLFVALHNNGSGNAAEAGTEVWYDASRPFADANFRLAMGILEGITGELRAAGYADPNRGLKNGATFREFNGRVFSLFVLGNPRTEPRPTRATMMPGALGESLFLSNPTEAALLAQDAVQDAIAQGYFRGISRYFGE